MRRLGIFGGSFDPIHLGHLAVARCALSQLGLSSVLFVPAARSPFKPEPKASEAHRLAMTQLAIAGIDEFQVSDWEICQGGVSYTLDTLKHFKQRFAPVELYLIMGEDTYAGFSRWHKPDEIRSLAQIAVAPRDGFMKSIQGRIFEGVSAPICLSMPLCDTSSSQLRSGLQRNELEFFGLPENVRQYIKKQGLYD